MSDHWQWALLRALDRFDPSHVTYLTDRMVFKHGALDALIEGLVDAFPSLVVTYNHDLVNDESRPIRIALHPSTGHVLSVPSTALLHRMAAGYPWHWEAPRMLNCVVPRAVLSTIQGRAGRVFGSLSPDIYFSCWVAAVEERFLCWDFPALAQYGLTRSNGYSMATGRASADSNDFWDLTSPGDLRTPYPTIRSMSNGILHEYGTVAAESRSPKFRPLDQAGVLAAIRTDAMATRDVELRARIQSDTPGDGPPTEQAVTVPRILASLRFRISHSALPLALRPIDPAWLPQSVRHRARVATCLSYRTIDSALEAVDHSSARSKTVFSPFSNCPVVTTVWPNR